jgi:hypothetical protein
MVGEQLIKRIVLRRVEPVRVAHLHRQPGFARPGRQESPEVIEQGGRVARRELQEDRTQPLPELAHHIHECLRFVDVLRKFAFMTDGPRHLRAKAECLRRLRNPLRQGFLGWNCIEGGVALDRRQAPGVLTQEFGGLRRLRVEIPHPTLERPDRAAKVKIHVKHYIMLFVPPFGGHLRACRLVPNLMKVLLINPPYQTFTSNQGAGLAQSKERTVKSPPIPRTVVKAILVLLAAQFACASYSFESSNEKPFGSTSAAPEGGQIPICSLLTPDEVTSILGAPAEGNPRAGENSGGPFLNCEYIASAGNTLTVQGGNADQAKGLIFSGMPGILGSKPDASMQQLVDQARSEAPNLAPRDIFERLIPVYEWGGYTVTRPAGVGDYSAWMWRGDVKIAIVLGSKGGLESLDLVWIVAPDEQTARDRLIPVANAALSRMPLGAQTVP